VGTVLICVYKLPSKSISPSFVSYEVFDHLITRIMDPELKIKSSEQVEPPLGYCIGMVGRVVLPMLLGSRVTHKGGQP
jgi:hypothetical protein